MVVASTPLRERTLSLALTPSAAAAPEGDTLCTKTPSSPIAPSQQRTQRTQRQELTGCQLQADRALCSLDKVDLSNNPVWSDTAWERSHSDLVRAICSSRACNKTRVSLWLCQKRPAYRFGRGATRLSPAIRRLVLGHQCEVGALPAAWCHQKQQ